MLPVQLQFPKQKEISFVVHTGLGRVYSWFRFLLVSPQPLQGPGWDFAWAGWEEEWLKFSPCRNVIVCLSIRKDWLFCRQGEDRFSFVVFQELQIEGAPLLFFPVLEIPLVQMDLAKTQQHPSRKIQACSSRAITVKHIFLQELTGNILIVCITSLPMGCASTGEEQALLELLAVLTRALRA